MTTPAQITICIVTHNNEKEFDIFASLLQKSINIPVIISVFDAGSVSETTKSIGKLLTFNNKGNYLDGGICGIGSAYNALLNTVTTEYCAFVPVNNIMSDDWLQTVLHHYKMIDESGVVSIKSQNDNLYISGLLADETIILNYLDKNNIISGLLFGKTSLLKEVNGFDVSMKINGYEIEEISHRIMLTGKKNYYVTHAKRYEMPVFNEVLFPNKTQERRVEFVKKIGENFKTTQHGQ